eukprot:13711709-Alexandrium_andersonii.AAC.1
MIGSGPRRAPCRPCRRPAASGGGHRTWQTGEASPEAARSSARVLAAPRPIQHRPGATTTTADRTSLRRTATTTGGRALIPRYASGRA